MKKVYLFFAFSFFLFSCGTSTEQLSKEVRQAMEAQFLKSESITIKIKEFNLIKKNETEYSGLLETEESAKSAPSVKYGHKYNDDVLFDGKTFKYEIQKAIN